MGLRDKTGNFRSSLEGCIHDQKCDVFDHNFDDARANVPPRSETRWSRLATVSMFDRGERRML
jgi:hypothetical protein